MEYARLAATLGELEATEGDEELVATLANLFREADDDHLPLLVTMVRGKLAPRWEELELGVSSSLTTEAILRATGVDRDDLEAAWRDRGDLGAAAEWAVANSRQATLVSRTLTVQDVYDDLRELASYEGAGSQDRKVETLAGLVSNADPREARYLVRTALGYMRIGVGDGTIRDAIAEAFLDVDGEPAAGTPTATDPAVRAVERAFQVTNDYREVATTARDAGLAGLESLDVELGRPVELMLARKAEGLAAGLANVARDDDVRRRVTADSESIEADSESTGVDDTAAAEAEDGASVETEDGASDPADVTAVSDGADEKPAWAGDVLAEVKYDGIRAQAHVTGDDVTLYTRRLVDVTEQFPETVAALEAGVTADSALLDGELVGYDGETGEPVTFQEFSRRVKLEEGIEKAARETPATFHLFDCLACDGATLLDEPLSARLDRLASAFEPREGLERAAATQPDSVAHARAFYREAVADGHEGVMVKNRSATYQPGRRVGQMLKHKPVMEPLDLVVTRAQYSEGRRSAMLGRLYLAVYDPSEDAFREIGRLSTGYTDEELQALTEQLEELVVERDGRDVTIRPELVLEVAYEEIQESPEYGSGFALRFPRFLGVRSDLAADDADTIDRVRELYER